MANPIRFGLVLEGKDAEDFDEYLKNPTCTPAGKKLIGEVNRCFNEERRKIQ